MSTITLRTDDEVERALAELGALPGDRNRSKVVRGAILSAARLHRLERDAAIYAAAGEDPELEGLAEWSARQPLDLD
jgi:hypothetical protein